MPCIDVEDRETVFVGPNNSGKTSATAIIRCFLGGKDFRIHDLSVSKMLRLNTFGQTGDADLLSSIELDMWFTIDPNSIDFGRAFSLLPGLSDEFTRLGVRMSFGPDDTAKLRAEYLAAYPELPNGTHSKTLAQYLGMDRNLQRLFEVSYFSLEEVGGAVVAKALDPKEGSSLLKTLVRVDFVDAQRNIDDDEAHRSNRLSAAFAAFYKKNLQRPAAATAAHLVIDENNQRLTDHYADQFSGLMSVIRGLGVPSINDRTLKLVSSLSPETALQGNTDLLYVDAENNHELPEMYNGLGFKNLIYMAIQAKHFHSQWLRTAENRPLCQVIFIEEPEVHLHAQVQQTFISKIWSVISASALEEGEANLSPQLVVTTHSSHILDAVDFAKVRYFRRCASAAGAGAVLNISQVHSLRHFLPEVPAPQDADEVPMTQAEALDFLKRYLKLTHCDLFFADAAILVEGTVEKLLLPIMIEKVAPRLSETFLTILEVGGAYAHRFESLLSFLHIPYLVVTDLDSVAAVGRHPACRADSVGALTSNATLKHCFAQNKVEAILALTAADKESVPLRRYVTFQMEVVVEDSETQLAMRSRTVEEAFAYQNFGMFRRGELTLGVPIPAQLSEAYEVIYQRVRSDSFKKTDFAMAVLACPQEWQVPSYITEGLLWLERRLLPAPIPQDPV